MSSNESDGMDVPTGRLEKAVDAALEEIERLRGELAETRSRTRELEDMLSGITSGERSPAQMMVQIDELEDANEDMKTRLEKGRESVDRLLAKIRFLEEQR